MVRQQSPSLSDSEKRQPKAITRRRQADFDIQQELAQLQDMIYQSFHLPLTRWTVVDEGKLLDQLDLISANIPDAIKKALAVLEQEQHIITEAEGYAQRIINSAQQRAAQILDETGIIQHAEQEAAQLRHQVQQECEAIQRQTFAEIEQLRQVTTQEIQQYRQQTLAECQDVQQGADQYADDVLTRLEQNLSEMLKVVRNGRQQLHHKSPQNKPPQTPPAANKLAEEPRKRL